MATDMSVNTVKTHLNRAIKAVREKIGESEMTGQHLSDEQFTDLLSGDCPLDASRHMLACAQCQSEFRRVRASMEDFVHGPHVGRTTGFRIHLHALGIRSQVAVCEYVGRCCWSPGCGPALEYIRKEDAGTRSHFDSRQPAS